MSVTSRALPASRKVSTQFQLHSVGKTLILPAAFDIVETMLGKSHAD